MLHLKYSPIARLITTLTALEKGLVKPIIILHRRKTKFWVVCIRTLTTILAALCPGHNNGDLAKHTADMAEGEENLV